MTIELDADPPRTGTRRPRWLVAGLVLAVAAAALVAVVVGGSPPPSIPPHDFDGRLRWIASLVDAPPRGAVAADDSFTRELGARIEQQALTGQGGGPPPQRPQARVLFADDVGTWRVALLAVQDRGIADERVRYAVTDLLWLIADRGASPQMLASGAGAEHRRHPVAPVAQLAFGDPSDPLWILLAPPECEVATTPAADLTQWRPDPAGYLARRLRSDVPLLWRATCAGVLREQGPAPRPEPAERELDWLMATAVGQPDREWLGYQVNQLTTTYGSELVSLGQVVWSGQVALSAAAANPSEIFTYLNRSDPVDTTVTVVVAPRAGGGWIGSVSTVLRGSLGEVWGVDDTTFAALANPFGLVAVRPDRWLGQVIVVAPTAVATVRIVDADGSTIDEAAGVEGAVVLALGEHQPTDGLRVLALDAAGAPIATAELADTNVAPSHTSDWG